MPPVIPLACAVLLATCGESRPTAPVVDVTAAGDTVLTPYSDVTDAAWLGGERWAVLVPSNDAAAIVDFSNRTARPLGGRGSKELRNPATLFLAEDTLYVGDWGLRRTGLWTPAGRLVRSIPTGDAVRGTLPRARDSAGQFYLDLYPRPGPDGSGNRDSAAVLRVDPAFNRPDTIARLAPLDIAEVVGDAGRRFERRVFGGIDRWGVLPDGSLWVARVFENRVDWRSPDGKWTKGQALPDRVLEVTRYDRELFVRGFPPELRTTAQELPFAPLKPPFEAGLTSPRGEVWLEKSRSPVDSARHYHVVDRKGWLAREIRLLGQGRILGVGDDSVLVAESTPDGTRLLRVVLPSAPMNLSLSTPAPDGESFL
ncbi:MAG TPA: hypothetical protein VFS51_05120 [Gemmatimonadales bacterium]|nr:hypothetical protein [Gemmatimonadales bacterium]